MYIIYKNTDKLSVWPTAKVGKCLLNSRNIFDGQQLPHSHETYIRKQKDIGSLHPDSSAGLRVS